MTSIQIYNPQGYAYDANWNGSELFPITDSCERIANVMGEDCVRLVFKLPNKVVFDAFAYIVYNGQTFFLKEQYIPTPDGTFMEDSGEISTADYSYDVKFVSVGNMLDKFICYRHVKVTNAGEWDEPEININGNLETLYVIIMGSIQQASNRLKAQYGQLYFADLLDTIVANGLDGNMPNTENVKLTANTNLLTFNFSGDNIANVCTTVANSFTNDDKKDTEWYIVENNGSLTLHFAKCVDVEYGVQYVSDYISNNNSADSFARPQKSGGLKKVEYSQAWSGITNVIVPYGSTRNMSYQAAKGIDEITQMQSTFGKRLRLTPNTSYNVKDKEGNKVIITTDSHGAIRNNYVDTGIEQVKFYDEIYPQGHFRVTSVDTKNKRQDGEIVPEYTVSGIAIDSKGNEIQPAEGFYPISIEEGTTLSVRFEKGLLNGREFEIANKTRKDEGATTYSLKFTIVADGSIEDGTLIPSGNFIPREGDEFALFNMKMPEVYITAAQQELAQRAYDELVELQTSRPQVKCTTDPTSWDKPIALGYQFKVMSELFNSEESFISRVTSYSYKLTKPYDVQFTLASAIMQGTLSQMNDLISDVTHQAGGLEQRAINLSRRGWRDAAEMAEMVDSLAADMMLVGNEKYQFAFTAGIEIVNSNNQTTAIKIGEGTLQHTQDPYISDYTCQGWWSHGAVTLNDGHTENGSAALTSVPDTPFYLYAVVGQNSTDISFELQDKEQDGEAYLLLGILSSAFTDTISGVTTNYRVFNRTNGYTQISGGTITTEQIQDAGRNLIIDFQSEIPRIIARGKAKIEGNIEFALNDEQINNIVGRLGEIGGKNLLSQTAFSHTYYMDEVVAYTKILSLDAGKTYVASYGKFEDNAYVGDEEWAKGVCLVVASVDNDIHAANIESVHKFGEPIEVNYNGRGLYIAWGQYDYVKIMGTDPQERAQHEFTQYLDEVMVQEGTTPTAFQPSLDEELSPINESVDSLRYLKTALENDTTVAGGLVATTQIQLRDKVTNDAGEEEYRTNAGISGVKDDNVLFWGGGTYEEAVNAASENNDFHVGENQTGRQITSLIKKDGQGKIGIFKISETQAVVYVPNQGKVIIDASENNGGIRILNSLGKINAALLPSSINSFKPLENDSVTGSEKVVYYSMSTQSFTSMTKTITLTRAGSFGTSGTTTETFEQYTKKTTITNNATKWSGNTILLNGTISTNGEEMTVLVTCALLYNDEELATITPVRNELSNGETELSLSDATGTFQNSTNTSVPVSDSYNLQLRITVSIISSSGGAINGVSLRANMGSIYMYYTATTSTTYEYSPQTIIGSDGMISLVSNNQYFMVDNSDNTAQKIYAKGLSQTKGTPGSGELYVTSDFINAFKAFVTKAKELFAAARYTGTNGDYRDDATTECDDILKELGTTSIIANS